MPDINDELLALVGQAPQAEPSQDQRLPDLNPAMMLSASAWQEVQAMTPQTHEAKGMDAFLVEGPPLPVDVPERAPLSELEAIWGSPEDRLEDTSIEGAGSNLEALFMGGREAQEAAEAQGYSTGGVSFRPPGPDSQMRLRDIQAGLDISFDTDWGEIGGGGGYAPNKAVRWTVGRESPPPAAPPMTPFRASDGPQDGVVVSSMQEGRFVPRARPRPQSISQVREAARSVQTTRAEAHAPAPAPMVNAPTIYQHLLSDD